MTQTMIPQQTSRTRGCLQAGVIILMLAWVGCLLVGLTMVAEGVSSGESSSILLFVLGLVLLGSLAGLVTLSRRRPGWEPVAATAAALLAVSGYGLLEGATRFLLPGSLAISLHGEGGGLACLRLLVSAVYVILAAWWVPRLAALPQRSLLSWLALDHIDWQEVLLGLAVSALVTLPWAVTGALGDRITGLVIFVQTLAVVLPRVLLVWGVCFAVLLCANKRRWSVALVVLSINLLLESGGFTAGLWNGTLQRSVINLGLAILLTELRARSASISQVFPVAVLSAVAGPLFTDPRDVIARGVPETAHIAAGAISAVIAASLGVAISLAQMLWIAIRGRPRAPAWGKVVAGLVAVVFCWGVWSGAYVFAGNPGFTNDGFLIILEEQSDVSFAAAISEWDARLQAVRDELVETAEQSQAPIRQELDRLGVPYRPYYIINMIRVDGHRGLMSRFADWPGVAEVIVNPNSREYPRRVPQPYPGNSQSSGALQSNLAAVRADDAWALGVMGKGIVVGAQDTGYEWTHPALRSHYRGWDGQTEDHNYNWHDAWDDSAEPFDDDGHGTHTMGTVLGDDGAGNLTGVAPGAQWIGCRNMRRGFGNPGSYAECMEFFLAPYPHGGDSFSDGMASMAPHVVNNSWGCPDFEGCSADTLKPAVEALRAAGIMMVVSAGNDGPECGTAGTPVASYDAVFSIAATDDDGSIALFSSRGPVGDLLKPDVSAPGASVRSSTVGGGYGYAGGTSMAAPHVAGLVALLWSADPGLIGDIDATEALICETAEPRPVDSVCESLTADGGELFGIALSDPQCACGDVSGVPNNVYGCGFIDAGAAVEAALAQ